MRITIPKLFRKIREWCSLKYIIRPLHRIKESTNSLVEYIVIKKSRRTLVQPIIYFKGEKKDFIEATLPESYVSIISNASIIGASNVILTDNALFYELLCVRDKRLCISDIGLFRVWNKPIHIGKRYVCCFSSMGDGIDAGIYLGGNFSGNYYHFVVEFISKFYLLEHCNIPSNIPIILDKSAKQIYQFNEIVSLFSQRDIIYVDRLQLRHVSKLYYPSFVNILPPNFTNIDLIKSDDCLFDQDAILYIRKRFLEYIEGYKSTTPSRFFISRKSSKWRKFG